ncbi:hypothetical protein [Gilvimarinus sp. 1_MG-2023]|uniref:hypothetical protein n=1 Tax=Gilvimarinus sp. 1_MG-2023 TaxID=3062638 RepID=UPI0026E3EC9D|nr:hypothetical protein [Gilvimarinus sp. 1_MG-2023]MDO6747077.1 hypothetical protein [Gilvimarinus sp. 1_MG-2023]
MFRGLLFLIFIVVLSGCFEKKREFSENEFIGATKFLCQKKRFSGSPLMANTFVLYYNKEKGIGNVGSYVYMGEYTENEIGEAHPYETDNALVMDDSIIFVLEALESERNLYVSINRETLEISMGHKSMNCEMVSDDVLEERKVQLISDHKAYKVEKEKANII